MNETVMWERSFILRTDAVKPISWKVNFSIHVKVTFAQRKVCVPSLARLMCELKFKWQLK